MVVARNTFFYILTAFVFLILGIFLGNAYTINTHKTYLQKKITDCTKNIDQVKWDSILTVYHHLDKSNLTITFWNKSDCFNFENISTKLLVYKKNNLDTISVTLKEIVHANKKTTINIQQFNIDSIKILQSVINQKSLNF